MCKSDKTCKLYINIGKNTCKTAKFVFKEMQYL